MVKQREKRRSKSKNRWTRRTGSELKDLCATQQWKADRTTRSPLSAALALVWQRNQSFWRRNRCSQFQDHGECGEQTLKRQKATE